MIDFERIFQASSELKSIFSFIVTLQRQIISSQRDIFLFVFFRGHLGCLPMDDTAKGGLTLF